MDPMKTKTFLLLTALVMLTGCAAMHSLFIHPLEKVHEQHEYNEQVQEYNRTNHVQP